MHCHQELNYQSEWSKSRVFIRQEPNLVDFWEKQSEDYRQKIRDGLITGLQSPSKAVAVQAASAIAVVASFDFEKGRWPGLIDLLNQGSQHQN